LGRRGILPRCKGQCHLRGNRREVRMFDTATGLPPLAGAAAPKETADADKSTVNSVATVIESYFAENASQTLNDFPEQQ
jgi:hypothetical protein